MEYFPDGIGFLSLEDKWTKWIKRKKEIEGRKASPLPMISMGLEFLLDTTLVCEGDRHKNTFVPGSDKQTLNSALWLFELGMLHLQTLDTGWCALGLLGSSDQPGLTLQTDVKASPLPCLQSWKSSWKNAQTLKRSMRILWLCGVKRGQPWLLRGRAAVPGVALQQRCSVHPHSAHKVQTPPAEMEIHQLSSLGVGKTEPYCCCLWGPCRGNHGRNSSHFFLTLVSLCRKQLWWIFII